ncbi:MAG: putative enoyl-CoA hydratase/isomerase [Actinomycetia bacterium]|nr:putative enoyl-CoA hydratase/isomerase [Actinomycetes bacterium]
MTEPRPVLRVESVDGGIRVLTLDRPDRLNALNAELIEQLHGSLDEIAQDSSCRVVILTGAGRGFCSGLDLQSVDLAAIAAGGPARQLRSQERIASLVPKLRGLPQPVIAAVNGPAAGGGFALALACDVRVAASSARFNVAFVRIGLSGCDIGVSWLLPRLVGASRAWELMLTGRIIDAERADRIGLLSEVVPDGEVLDAALAIAREIAGNSPLGVRMTKQVMWSALEVGSLNAGIDLENRTQVLCTFDPDMDEAVHAFMERRPPEFGSAAP